MKTYSMSLAPAKLKGLKKAHHNSIKKYARDFFKNVLQTIKSDKTLDDYDLVIEEHQAVFKLKQDDKGA
jgi:hypothetical protein